MLASPWNVFNTFSRFEMNLPAAQGGDSERFLVVVAIVFVPGRGYRGGQVWWNVDGPSQDDVIEQQLADTILVFRSRRRPHGGAIAGRQNGELFVCADKCRKWWNYLVYKENEKRTFPFWDFCLC